MKFSEKNLFIFDLEGVLCTDIDDPRPYPNGRELISKLKSIGKKVMIVSNITRKSKRDMLERLQSIGFDVTHDEILTASSTAALYVKSNHPNARCFVISEGGLIEDFLEQRIKIVNEKPVDVVVIAADRSITYAKLNFAMRCVLEGAVFLCAGMSPLFKGSFLGDEGLFLGEAAIAEAIRFATRKPIKHLGKPFPEIFVEALKTANAKSSETIMVGDTLSSDIEGAKSLGIEAVHVRNRQKIDYAALDPKFRPDMVVDEVGELYTQIFS